MIYVIYLFDMDLRETGLTAVVEVVSWVSLSATLAGNSDAEERFFRVTLRPPGEAPGMCV